VSAAIRQILREENQPFAEAFGVIISFFVPAPISFGTSPRMLVSMMPVVEAYLLLPHELARLPQNSPRFRMTIRTLALTMLLTSAASTATAQTGFIDKTHSDGAKYVIFVPHDYNGDTPYPIILFLHGAGETGEDGQKQVSVGLGKAIKKQEKTFPFIVVFPQSKKRTWSAGSDDGKRAIAILDDVMKNYKVDPKRQYLTGLSMGGFGTWSAAAVYPDRWAAIAPICGGGDVKAAAKIKDIPTWNFHGDKDKAVNVELSRKMIAAIKEAGGDPKYTEYPGVEHNSWDAAYATPELFPWLLKQSKK
jgi:predicted peptidase